MLIRYFEAINNLLQLNAFHFIIHFSKSIPNFTKIVPWTCLNISCLIIYNILTYKINSFLLIQFLFILLMHSFNSSRTKSDHPPEMIPTSLDIAITFPHIHATIWNYLSVLFFIFFRYLPQFNSKLAKNKCHDLLFLVFSIVSAHEQNKHSNIC